MKFIFKIFLVVAVFLPWFATQGQNTSRPNVIIILSDDQGYADYSINGNPVLETPSIDRIATEGIRFADFHVSPYCTPTRGELLSGLDALHNQAATVGTGRNTMRRDIQTLPEVFKYNGYRTGIFGKWHLGDNYPDRPMDRGFEKSVWFHGWGLLSEYEYNNDYYRTRYLDNLTTIQSEQYCTDLWFDQAIQWMNKMSESNQPFFAYIPTNAPHGPFLAPKEDYEYYKDKVKDSTAAAFFGMIRNIDKNVAKLDKWLEEKNLKENTIVIYLNDNGGTGGVNVYNANMKGKKGQVYEGGHRAGCFFRWPASNLGTNRIIPTTSEVQDLFPTLIELLNLKTNSKLQKLDGVSLVPVLKKKSPIKDRMFVVQYGGGVRPEKYFSCVVWNDWRLIGSNELYNIKNDIGQTNNIAEQHPQILKKMLSFYDGWWAKREKDIDNFVPIFLGASQQDTALLTSDFWANGDYVNTQWKVALADGPANGGVWHIRVKKSGLYEIELSRWPFFLNQPLQSIGIGKAVGGYKLRRGKALPIEYGHLSVNGKNPISADIFDKNSSTVSMKVRLTSSDTTLRAWFTDGNQNDLCGAYYLRVHLIE